MDNYGCLINNWSGSWHINLTIFKMSAKGKKEVTIKTEKGKEKEKDEKVEPNATKGPNPAKGPTATKEGE